MNFRPSMSVELNGRPDVPNNLFCKFRKPLSNQEFDMSFAVPLSPCIICYVYNSNFFVLNVHVYVWMASLGNFLTLEKFNKI